MVKGKPSYGICSGCNGTGVITKKEEYIDDKGKRRKMITTIPHSTCGGTGKIFLGNI